MTHPLDRPTAELPAAHDPAAHDAAAQAPSPHGPATPDAGTPAARPFDPTAFAPTALPRTLELPDGTLAYDEQGEGPLVVLVPGLGDLRQEYRYLAPRLAAAGYRAVSVDLRGHGGSSPRWPSYAADAFAADLVALIEHLGGGPAAIVGNSFAADPAVRVAARRPELVSRLVLIGAFVRAAKVGPGMRALMRLLFTGPWRVRAWAWYYGTLFPGRKPEDFAAYRRALARNLAEPGRFEAVRALIFRNEPSVEAELGRLLAPTLAIMGSRDPDFPDPAAEAAWIAAQSRGEAAVIDGAGHYPFSERPDVTAERILAFLAGSPAAGEAGAGTAGTGASGAGASAASPSAASPSAAETPRADAPRRDGRPGSSRG